MQNLADETVGQRVRELREARGLTQQKLATDADIAVRTLASLEAGSDVSLSTLRKLAAVLGVKVGDLLEAS